MLTDNFVANCYILKNDARKNYNSYEEWCCKLKGANPKQCWTGKNFHCCKIRSVGNRNFLKLRVTQTICQAILSRTTSSSFSRIQRIYNLACRLTTVAADFRYFNSILLETKNFSALIICRKRLRYDFSIPKTSEFRSNCKPSTNPGT